MRDRIKSSFLILGIIAIVGCGKIKPSLEEISDLMPNVRLDQIVRISPSKYTDECLIGFDTNYDGKIDLIAKYKASRIISFRDNDYLTDFVDYHDN